MQTSALKPRGILVACGHAALAGRITEALSRALLASEQRELELAGLVRGLPERHELVERHGLPRGFERKEAPGVETLRRRLPLEVKLAGSEAEGMTFSGYGAVFDNVDAYGDVIKAGAFAETLQRARDTNEWPAMLLQHGGFTAEDNTPIGIWTALEEDSIGLKVSGKFADTARGREAYALLKMAPRPAIDGLSIGYIPKEWSMRSRPEEPRRTLKKVDLVEVSLVTFPANPKARVQAVKSGLTIRDAERALRDAGFSAQESKAILAEGFTKGAAPRDAGELSEIAALIERSLAVLKA